MMLLDPRAPGALAAAKQADALAETLSQSTPGPVLLSLGMTLVKSCLLSSRGLSLEEAAAVYMASMLIGTVPPQLWEAVLAHLPEHLERQKKLLREATGEPASA